MVLHHWAHFASKNIPFDVTAPLASYYFKNRRLQIRSGNITDHIQGRLYLFSLRAGGAMALLCGHCDSNTIKLLGPWHSDAMMQNFASRGTTSLATACQEDV